MREGNGTENPQRSDATDFELFVQSVHDYAIFMLDPTGRVRTWNMGAQRIKGYARDEIVGHHFSVFYPPEDVAASKPQGELRIAAAAGRLEDEGWRVRKDGTRFWANVVITAIRDETGRLVGFGKVTRDLTDRRRMEETLRQSEERFRLLIGSVKDCAIFMLDQTGNVTTWSSGARAIKGYEDHEILGRHFSLFYPPEEVSAGKPERVLERAREAGHYEEEGLRVRKDGTRFWASVTVTAIRAPSGELVGYAKVTRDLTERKRAEDERLRLAHVEEGLKLRDDFLSIASHELRTPLTALKLQLEYLAESAPGHDRFRTQLSRALVSLSRLTSLIDTLLDVTNITSGRLRLQREPMEIGTAASEVVAQLQETAQRAGSTIAVHRRGSARGSWDRLRIEQVLFNLLHNALKYGAGAPIEVETSSDGTTATVVVSDRGPGIAEQDLGRIFRRFERAASRRHYGGLGLGLYVAHQLVEAHGGTIEVASAPGRGATFTVRLPLQPPEDSSRKAA